MNQNPATPRPGFLNPFTCTRNNGPKRIIAVIPYISQIKPKQHESVLSFLVSWKNMNLHAKFACSHSCCQSIFAFVPVVCIYSVVHVHQTLSNAYNVSDTQRMQHRGVACMFTGENETYCE